MRQLEWQVGLVSSLAAAGIAVIGVLLWLAALVLGIIGVALCQVTGKKVATGIMGIVLSMLWLVIGIILTLG